MWCHGRTLGSHLRLLVWVGLLLCGGCEAVRLHCNPPAPIPHELCTAPMPTYVIEPPDVLLIDAIRLVPKPPYRVQPLDVLGIQVTNTLPNAPIAGPFSVDPDGTINLGFTYGSVRVDGMTLAEVKKAIEEHLKLSLKPPYVVTVVLLDTRGLQQVRGSHLVRPDGTVGLGIYGSVNVDGLTIEEATTAIQNHLALYFVNPQVSLDVAGFNSKVYYVISDAAVGDVVSRFPVTGKTTVLDAISQVNGLSQVSSKNVFLVRPTVKVKTREVKAAARFRSCDQPPEIKETNKLDEEVYPVDWQGIVVRGDARTNYEVMPGDRVYVMVQPLIAGDTYLGLFLAPFERAFGVVGLGNSTVRTFLTPIPLNTTQLVSP